jgi:hypothetical protein
MVVGADVLLLLLLLLSVVVVVVVVVVCHGLKFLFSFIYCKK